MLVSVLEVRGLSTWLHRWWSACVAGYSLFEVRFGYLDVALFLQRVDALLYLALVLLRRVSIVLLRCFALVVVVHTARLNYVGRVFFLQR